MTRDEIVAKMLAKPPRTIFYPMQLGASTAQLRKMEDAGLISSQRRYMGGSPQRDYYLSHEQHGRNTAATPAAN